ncbi:MAG: SWIM zinc finger domain-containing protein [Candidatus Sericytochromatia bacterium]
MSARLAFLSQARIRQWLGADEFRSAQKQQDSPVVFDLILLSRQLRAKVRGTAVEPYVVSIEAANDAIGRTRCSCPSNAALCKHILAVLMRVLQEPEAIEIPPPLPELVKTLQREQLQALLLQLAQTDGEHELELYRLLRPQSVATAPPPSPKRLEASVRQRLEYLLNARGYQSRYRVKPEQILEACEALLSQAQDWLKAGQAEAAIAILAPVGELIFAEPECLMDTYNDFEIECWFEDMGKAWQQAILMTPDRKALAQGWKVRLEAWIERLVDYGLEKTFQAALKLLHDPCSQKLLQAAISGEVEPESWKASADAALEGLVPTQLEQLKQAGMTQQALNLAYASGRLVETALLMLKLGQGEEVLEYLGPELDAMQPGDDCKLDLTAVCRALEAKELREDALTLAEDALNQGLADYSLCCWLRDSDAGEAGAAAAREAVLKRASLADYELLKQRTGPSWSDQRQAFLADLAAAWQATPTETLAILLAEGEHRQAMRIAETARYAWDDVRKTVEHLLAFEAQWCQKICRQQADAVLDASRSKAYHHALDWLELGARASAAAKQQAQWRDYLQELIRRHRRKFSLIPRLEALLQATGP